LGKAFAQAEKQGLIAQELFGIRKAKGTVTQCLNKHLWYDYVCFYCKPAALCSNDAKNLSPPYHFAGSSFMLMLLGAIACHSN